MRERKDCILIVDDTPQNCALLVALLGAYDTVVANSGEEALAVLAGAQGDAMPDLVLLDVMMPGLNGYEVAHQIKANPQTQGIPIIMVTALDDRQAKQASLDSGAEEFLSKPIDRAELLVRVRNMLRLRRQSLALATYNEQLEAQVQARTAALSAEIVTRKQAEAEAHFLNRHDALTKLPNHVYFQETVRSLLDQARAEGTQVAVVILALDQLRLVIQTQGRPVRDQLIAQVAMRLSCTELGQHFLAHLEPGVFAIALGPYPGLDRERLNGAITHCINDALNAPFELAGIVLQLTPRVGISPASVGMDTPESLIQAADLALYWSGQPGQEAVQWYSPELAEQVRESRQTWADVGLRIGRLSPREREVADLIVAGNSTKMIAYKLGTSDRTVDAQRVRIMDKLQAHTLADVVRMMMAPSVRA
jgi:diguanylate cyclase (GGDEF)-like protein